MLRVVFLKATLRYGNQPWSPPQDLPRTGPIAIEIVLKVTQNPAPFQNQDSIGNPVLQASLVPPWCIPGCLNGSFLPPWCFAGCLFDPFRPPWCLPGCPNGSLRGYPNDLLAPPGLFKWPFNDSWLPWSCPARKGL